jgi:membrane protease YdiL (CAAX protease family)
VCSGIIVGLAQVAFRFVPRPGPRQQPDLPAALAIEVVQAVAVLLTTALMAKFIDKKPWRYFGLPIAKAFQSAFWVGALSGFATLALQLELMHFGGWFNFGALALHGGSILKYGFLWSLVFLLTGLFEESFLRGYPQRVLTNGMRFWPAAILLSAIFGAGHISNPGENYFGLVMVFIDGIVMSVSLWRTGNLWFAVGNHAAWDWAETFFFGTPNSGLRPSHALLSPSFSGPPLLSGGTDGPEGSVLVLVSEMLVVILVAVLYPRRRYELAET